MSRLSAAALGIATICPLVLTVALLASLLFDITVIADGLMAGSEGSFVWAVSLVFCCIHTVLLVIYLYNVANHQSMRVSLRGIWALLLFSFGDISMLAYWYKYIWAPKQQAGHG